MKIAEVDERNATGCFHGLRVLDFSTTIAGPHCGRMLADMGVEVIKIESAEGETMRIRPPVRNGCSSLFGQLNAGKKSVVLTKACGHPEWASDPRFAKYADRRNHWSDLMDGLESWSRTTKTADCLARLSEHGVPCAAYRTVAEALRDPQLAHRGALAEVEDAGGTFKVVNLPFRMSGTKVAAGKRAASLGEHTLALLAERGFSPAQIEALVGKPVAEPGVATLP